MAILIEPLLDEEVDLARLLKMIIIHDLVEAEAGDVSVLDQIRNPEIRKIKQQNEELAILKISQMLATSNRQKIYDLFYEFEKKTIKLFKHWLYLILLNSPNRYLRRKQFLANFSGDPESE